MASVLDVPALQGPPNIANALQMLSEGLEMRRQRQEETSAKMRAQQIGGQLASGDMTGAANTAFQAGDVATGLKIHELSGEQRKQFGMTVARIAASAETPQAWETVRQKLTQLTGQDPGDFETGRTELINEARDLDAILGDQESRREAGSKAPDVVSINGIDHIWDPEQRRLIPQAGGISDADKAAQKQNGITVRTNPDGTVETIIGGSSGTPLGTSGQNKVDEKAINMAEMGSRLSGIMESFRPEYQTLGTRLTNLWRSGKAAIDPGMLGPGEEQALTEFAQYRSQSIGNLNRILNELSGAAVSEAEAKRLQTEIPNPGTGIFDGDDPVSFKAKLESVSNQVNRALARYQYYKLFGIPDSIEKIPLNNVKQIAGKWYVKDGDNVYEIGSLPTAAPQ